MAAKAELKAISLSSKRNAVQGAPAFHLMEVEDYVGKDDARLAAFVKAFEDPGASVTCVGGYPVPPSYSRTVKTQEQAA